MGNLFTHRFLHKSHPHFISQVSNPDGHNAATPGFPELQLSIDDLVGDLASKREVHGVVARLGVIEALPSLAVDHALEFFVRNGLAVYRRDACAFRARQRRKSRERHREEKRQKQPVTRCV